MTKVIGITGGVGCGKSTVLDILKNEYNAKIIEADKVGHIVMEKGNIAYDDVVELFGNDILDSEGNIDRKILARKVFNDKALLKRHTDIVHPAVKEYISKFIDTQKKNNEELVIVEAALLIEAGYRDLCDEFWYVRTFDEIRRSRLKLNRGYTDEHIDSIVKNQLSDKQFIDKTDKILENNKNVEELRENIKKLI